MAFLYNLALRTGFLLLTPRFLYDAATKGKYAAGFSQRLGFVPEFKPTGQTVVLLHCVSVGEANAALPLANALRQRFPDVGLVVSTTTNTGQKVASEVYSGIADLVVYFPFDFPGSVRRFLQRIAPDVVLLTETELWYNFIRSASQTGSRIAIVNGRLSERSRGRYARVRRFMSRLFSYVDLALMQSQGDAERILSLAIDDDKVRVTGNLKYDIGADSADARLTEEFRERFGLAGDAPLILAASTHDPEEKLLLDAFREVRETSAAPARLMIAPRHPERFATVAKAVEASGYRSARRSHDPADGDRSADVILLDSIGELRSAYPLADIVFVGGSLIPHGGQSIFEPAAAAKAIVTGPYTANFNAAVNEFISRDALVQLQSADAASLTAVFADLLRDTSRRTALGANALAVIEANRGAVDKTLEQLAPLLSPRR